MGPTLANALADEPSPPVAAAPSAKPNESPEVVTRFGAHEGFTRIVLEWRGNVKAWVAVKDGVAAVTFNRKGRINAAHVNELLPPAMRPARVSADGTGLTFRVPAGVHVRDLSYANLVIIDLVQGEPTEAEAKPSPATPPPKPAGATAPSDEPTSQPTQSAALPAPAGAAAAAPGSDRPPSSQAPPPQAEPAEQATPAGPPETNTAAAAPVPSQPVPAAAEAVVPPPKPASERAPAKAAAAPPKPAPAKRPRSEPAAKPPQKASPPASPEAAPTPTGPAEAAAAAAPPPPSESTPPAATAAATPPTAESEPAAAPAKPPDSEPAAEPTQAAALPAPPAAPEAAPTPSAAGPPPQPGPPPPSTPAPEAAPAAAPPKAKEAAPPTPAKATPPKPSHLEPAAKPQRPPKVAAAAKAAVAGAPPKPSAAAAPPPAKPAEATETPPVETAMVPVPVLPPGSDEPTMLAETADRHLKVIGTPLSDGFSLQFQWDVSVKAASFKLRDTVWVVFDQPERVSFNPRAPSGGGMPVMTQTTNSLATVLHMAVPDDAVLVAGRAGNTWLIDVRRAGPWQAADTSPHGRALVAKDGLYATSKPGQPVTVVDPDSGEVLLAVPVWTASVLFADNEDHESYHVLPTAQGMLFRPETDRVRIQIEDDGARVVTVPTMTTIQGDR